MEVGAALLDGTNEAVEPVAENQENQENQENKENEIDKLKKMIEDLQNQNNEYEKSNQTMIENTESLKKENLEIQKKIEDRKTQFEKIDSIFQKENKKFEAEADQKNEMSEVYHKYKDRVMKTQEIVKDKSYYNQEMTKLEQELNEIQTNVNEVVKKYPETEQKVTEQKTITSLFSKLQEINNLFTNEANNCISLTSQSDSEYFDASLTDELNSKISKGNEIKQSLALDSDQSISPESEEAMNQFERCMPIYNQIFLMVTSKNMMLEKDEETNEEQTTGSPEPVIQYSFDSRFVDMLDEECSQLKRISDIEQFDYLNDPTVSQNLNELKSKLELIVKEEPKPVEKEVEEQPEDAERKELTTDPLNGLLGQVEGEQNPTEEVDKDQLEIDPPWRFDNYTEEDLKLHVTNPEWVVEGEELEKLAPVQIEQQPEEPKQEEPKQEEPKQEEPKQEEPKQEEPKQEEPKQEEQPEAKERQPLTTDPLNSLFAQAGENKQQEQTPAEVPKDQPEQEGSIEKLAPVQIEQQPEEPKQEESIEKLAPVQIEQQPEEPKQEESIEKLAPVQIEQQPDLPQVQIEEEEEDIEDKDFTEPKQEDTTDRQPLTTDPLKMLIGGQQEQQEEEVLAPADTEEVSKDQLEIDPPWIKDDYTDEDFKLHVTNPEWVIEDSQKASNHVNKSTQRTITEPTSPKRTVQQPARKPRPYFKKKEPFVSTYDPAIFYTPFNEMVDEQKLKFTPVYKDPPPLTVTLKDIGLEGLDSPIPDMTQRIKKLEEEEKERNKPPPQTSSKRRSGRAVRSPDDNIDGTKSPRRRRRGKNSKAETNENEGEQSTDKKPEGLLAQVQEAAKNFTIVKPQVGSNRSSRPSSRNSAHAPPIVLDDLDFS